MPRCARFARRPRSTTFRSIGAWCIMDTGPYNKGKISRYYIARSKETQVRLPVNPELGVPEHHEARWVDYDRALAMVSPRLVPVVRWAYRIINRAGASPRDPPASSRQHRAASRVRSRRRRRESAVRRRSRDTATKAGRRIRPARSRTRSGSGLCIASTPSAEIGGGRTGRGILEHRPALREEKARQHLLRPPLVRTHRPSRCRPRFGWRQRRLAAARRGARRPPS